MSTTDTRAAFEAWALERGFNLNFGPDGKNYISGHTQSIWEPWQAATEAAKATGTAGEHSHQGNRYGNLTDAEYIEMTRQEAARQPAPVAIKERENE